MRKASCYILLLTVFLYYKGNSQFLVLPAEKQTGDYFHALLPQINPNQFQVVFIRDYSSITPYREQHQILTYNLNGQSLDSINLPRGFFPIDLPFKDKDFYYWSFLYMDTNVVHPNTQDAFLLKFDTLFNCIAKKRISNQINSSEFPTNTIAINTNLFVSVRNNVNNSFRMYKLDLALNKIDSIFDPNLHFISELRETHNNQILVAGNGFPTSQLPGPQKTLIDTMLHIVNVHTLDSLTYVTAGSSPVTGCSMQIKINTDFFKVIPTSPTKNYVVGFGDVVYDSVCNTRYNLVHSVIDHNNKLLHTTLINNPTQNVKYLDNVNFTSYNGQHIYTVGSEGNTQGWLLNNVNTSILITKSDTMANLIWKKIYGNDAYYRPVSIIQTADSGLLISGIRFEYQNTLYNKGQGFILRLNKNGDVLSTGIREYDKINYNSVTCFPNPTINVIYFDVPFTSNYQIEIYDALGKMVYSNTNYKNKTPVTTELFGTGIYIYKIKTNESYSSGKFIKE